MTSLPISINKPQPSGNAANASQTNIAADAQLTDTRLAEPFAFLLARQIGEAGLPALTAAQIAVANDGNAADDGADPALKDAQDQTAAAANIPNDPASTLATILMQLPAPGDRTTQRTDAQQPAQPFAINPFQKTDAQQPAQLVAISPFQKTDAQQPAQLVAISPSHETGHNKPIAGSEDSQIIQLPAINHRPSEAVKYAELPSGLTQPVENTAQAIALQTMPAAMPGMLTNNTPAGTPPTISTPLGNHGWADEFSQKISWMSTQQNQVAELHLNPPNLGPLDVVLKISDNQATVLFTSPHAAVRDAVENALPKLREILADNGIMLGNAMVSDQSPRDRSAEGFAKQGSGTAAPREVFDAVSESTGPSPSAAPARRHNGMVDTFA